MIYHKNNIYGALNAFINQELLEDIAAHINDCALLESQGWGFSELPEDKLAYADLQEIWLMQTRLVYVDGATAYCYPRFGCRFLLHAVDGYDPETAEDETALNVPVRIIFRGKKYETHFGKVHPDGDYYLPEFPGVATRHDFIPAMSGSEAQMQDMREAEAERFLRQYYPAALEKVIPVPIRQIAEKQLHMSFILDKELSDDLSTLGETVFETKQMVLRDSETGALEPVVVRRGTAVIDSNVFWQRGYGSMNFTIAHEVYHWFAHRAHWSLMQYVDKPADYGHLKWVMEVQAKAFAGRVLMPKRSVKLMYADLLLEYAGSDEADTYEMIVSQMAQFFLVSKTSIRTRLKELGLHDDQRKPAAARRMLDMDEVFELYAADKDFRSLLDRGDYLYIENYIVRNDDLYIDGDRMTSYARSHLSECTLSFREKRVSVPDEGLSSGMQSYQRFTLTFDYDVSMKSSPEKMEKAGEQLRKAFEAYVASEESQTFCEFMYPIVYDVNTEHLKPDIVTLAKGLAGGVPIGAFVARGEVAEAMKPGDHGTTFGGNPLACAAANVVLDTVPQAEFLGQIEKVGGYFKEKLVALQEKYPQLIKEVRGEGLILGAELTKDNIGRNIVNECLAEGIIINCTVGKVLRFIPPLIITEAQVDEVMQALYKVLAKY